RCRLRVENLDRILAGIALQETEWHDCRFAGNLRLSERRDTFFEDTNHRESQLADSNVLPHRVDARKNRARQFLCDEASLAMRLHVSRIEITARHDDQVAYSLETFSDCDERDGTLNASGNDRHLDVVSPGSLGDVGYFAARRFEIL